MAEPTPFAWQVGCQLPGFQAPPISRHTLALYCGASSDYNPIHVDIDFARSAGMPDVFAHGMLGMAYLAHVLTAVAPMSALRSYGVRFVAVTHVGDSLCCTAQVAGIVERNGERIAQLSLSAVDQKQQIKLLGDAEIALSPATATQDDAMTSTHLPIHRPTTSS